MRRAATASRAVVVPLPFAMKTAVTGARRIFRHKWFRIVFGLAVSVLMMWLAVRRIDLAELGHDLQSASLRWIALGVLFYALELVFRVERWARILSPVRRLRYRDVGAALLIGYAANNVLPAKIGELFRADFIGRRHGISRVAAVGTIVVERLLDMGIVIFCTIMGILLADPRRSLPDFLLSGTAIAMAGLVLVSIALVILAKQPFPEAWLSRFPRASVHLGALVSGLRSFGRSRLFVGVAGLSAVVWLCNAWAVWAVLNAVGVDAGYATVLLVIGVAGIAAAIPAAPANLGTLQLAFVTTLTATGYSATAGFAAALLIQVFFMGSVTFAGAALYAVRHWQPVKRGGDAAT